MKQNWMLAICCAAFFAAGGLCRAESLPADVLAAFRSPTRVMLYSLDPNKPIKGGFHGFVIVGVKPIDDPATQQALGATLQKHVAAGGAGAFCFIPRHAIRLIVGRTIHDIVICYECGHVHIHTTGRPMRRLPLEGAAQYFDDLLPPPAKSP